MYLMNVRTMSVLIRSLLELTSIKILPNEYQGIKIRVEFNEYTQ